MRRWLISLIPFSALGIGACTYSQDLGHYLDALTSERDASGQDVAVHDEPLPGDARVETSGETSYGDVLALDAVIQEAEPGDGPMTSDSEPSEDSGDPPDEPDLGGQPIPWGTYENSTFGVGEMSLVVLKSDKTFYREIEVLCEDAPEESCDHISSSGETAGIPMVGIFEFTKQGSARYIRFMNAGGSLIDRWEYELIPKEKAPHP